MTTSQKKKAAHNWEIVEVQYSTLEESQERLLRAVTRVYEIAPEKKQKSNPEITEEESVDQTDL